jgi:hypothetical protein
MGDRTDALYAMRVRVASRRQTRIGSVVAAHTAADADSRLYVLSFWKGTHYQWPRRNFLCASAYGCRGYTFLMVLEAKLRDRAGISSSECA